MNLSEFLKEKRVPRSHLAALVDMDPSTIGKKLDHQRVWKIPDLLAVQRALERHFKVKVSFGRLCTMAAEGLEETNG